MTDRIKIDGAEFDIEAVRKALAEHDAKPKQGKIDWQRVIDEGYLCCTCLTGGWHPVVGEEKNYVQLLGFGRAHKTDVTIRRVPNEKQPHFGSEGLPEGVESADRITIYLRNGTILMSKHSQNFDWKHEGRACDIMAFIVHKPIGGTP